MNPHGSLDDAARDLAALYALDAMEDAERETYDAHLAACGPCRAEVAGLRDVASLLSELPPAMAPPPALRDRLLASVAGPRTVERHAVSGPPDREADPAQSWKTWATDSVTQGVLLLGADASGWEETGFHGVQARRLFVDAAADRVTMLVRMAAGSAYPPHVHAGPEECFVLSGDLDVGGVTMTAGSYQRVAAGSRHPVQSTKDGCLLLLVSSLHDELLTA